MTPDRAIAEVARNQYGLISRAQAIECGLSSRCVDLRLARAEWEPLFRGVYRLSGTGSSWRQQVMAAVIVAGPGAVASHRSAGSLLDLPNVVRRLEVTVPADRRVAVEGLIVHRSKYLSAEDLRPVRGIPATAPARTMVDLASIYDGSRMGEILDEAAAQRLLTRSELVGSLGRVGPGGRAGAGLVAELLAERPAGRRAMGSRLERRLFGALKGAGLPLPIPQFRILLPGGKERFCDFAFVPPISLGIELVSFRWHGDLHSWADDVERDSEIVSAGWAILPTTSYRIMYQPDRVVEQIGQALAARGVGPLAHR